MPHDAYRRMAALMLAKGWVYGPMKSALSIALENPPRAAAMVDYAWETWRQPYPPSEATLAELLEDLWRGDDPNFPPILAPPALQRPVWATPLDLPALATPDALADWLGVTIGQLHWLADCDGRLARNRERIGHYEQTWLSKRSGARRLVEAPLPRLKAVQRRILNDLLNLVPSSPDSFGFVRGRDCRGHAARHTAEEVVICLDLADFFPSVRASRVHAIFRTLGYSVSVSRLLCGLVTTHTPPDVAAAMPHPDRWRWTTAHLPQGAPTSPSLANLSARGQDIRLAALARRLGAAYSRYADDLAISGDRGLAFDGARPVLEFVSEIVRDEGFRINHAKTRVQHQSGRQKVTGMVVNRHLNLPRPQYDRLNAILTNCVRNGPASQNREKHPDFRAWLSGRVGWAEQVNPGRGSKLRALLDQVRWPV